MLLLQRQQTTSKSSVAVRMSPAAVVCVGMCCYIIGRLAGCELEVAHRRVTTRCHDTRQSGDECNRKLSLAYGAAGDDNDWSANGTRSRGEVT